MTLKLRKLRIPMFVNLRRVLTHLASFLEQVLAV